MMRNLALIWLLCLSAISHSNGSRGLTNIGNTCYANSVVQSLYHTPEYRNSVLSKEFLPNSAGAALRQIFEKLQLCNDDNEVDVASLLRPLQLQRHRCEDAHEFLLNVLSKVDDSVLSGCALSYVFQGEQEDFTSFTSSKATSSQIVPYLALPLAIAPEITSLTEAIERLRSVETVEEGSFGRKAISGTRITKIPPYLWFHLNRFTYNRSSDQVEKLSYKLSFPLVLNTAVLDSRFSTDLYLKCVITHSGSSSRGHYKMFLRPLPSLLPQYWLLFDDAHVKEVTYKHVKQASTGNNYGNTKSSVAYMVQYAKKDENKTNVEDIVCRTLLSPIDSLRDLASYPSDI